MTNIKSIDRPVTLEQLEPLLERVEKPGRYIGGEYQAIVKPDAEVRFGFAFPDQYEIGMSCLGLQILYEVINEMPDIAGERLFAPAPDMEKAMRETGLPLYTLENGTPAGHLDIIGFTLQYELSYTNVLNMLDLAGLPLDACDRTNAHPLIIAGGPCAFHPEPMARFIDCFVVGDGEAAVRECIDVYRQYKREGRTRNELLGRLAKLPGFYVPAFYEPISDSDGRLTGYKRLSDEAPLVVRKRITEDLDAAPYPEHPIVPLVETVHNRAAVELFRGCTRGCRFCQAGMIYRPVRERSSEQLAALAEQQIACTGHDELSLLSLATNDYSAIEPLIDRLMELSRNRQVALSLPSLRLDAFSFRVLNEIQKYKKTGLTFAPEAGTQRLRDVINKTITDADIYDGLAQAFELGWSTVKLYFMIGLPTETDEDLSGITDMARTIVRIGREKFGKAVGRLNLTVSLSHFVPKPHTPFQWFPQDRPEVFRQKIERLREEFRPLKHVRLQYHDPGQSHIEALLAKGGRETGALIREVWAHGSAFDAWRESFDYGRWTDAVARLNFREEETIYREGGEGDFFPWDIIDPGVEKRYLWEEWQKAGRGEWTPDCRRGCTGCGVDRLTDCFRRQAEGGRA